MKEQLIEFDTAKLAKEKGFDISVINYYDKKGRLTYSEDYQTERLAESNWNNSQGSYPTLAEEVSCSAPTQSLLQEWLREEHNIHVVAIPSIIMKSDWEDEIEYYYNVYSYNGILSSKGMETFSYEEAIEKGLQEALKLIEI